MEHMELATHVSSAEKDILLHEAVELMKKATQSSTAAIDCDRQLDNARTALAHFKEQLATTSDVIASAVYRGLTKAWGIS